MNIERASHHPVQKGRPEGLGTENIESLYTGRTQLSLDKKREVRKWRGKKR